MPTVATYFTFSDENGGTPSSLDQFRASLSTFDRRRLLHICSVMNAALRHESEPINQVAHDNLLKTFFRGEQLERFLRREGEVRFVFHRQQVLYVAKQVLAWCQDDGVQPQPPEWNGLGQVFLMANDHLLTSFREMESLESLEDKMVQLAAHFIPVQEASSFHRFDHKMMRSYLMISSAAESLRDKHPFYDIPHLFKEVTGLPLRTFQCLLFGALTRFMKFDERQYVENPANYGLRNTWFRSTTVSSEHIDRFLNYVSATPEEFAAKLERGMWGPSDFTIFRDKPLFRDGDTLFLVDYAFLAEKFETGPFWTIHNSLPPDDREHFHSFWGSVFETYVNSVIGNAVDGRLNILTPSPHYASDVNEQVCDAVVRCGRNIVFIESKGTTFRADAKYKGDYQLLRQEVTRKLVQDDGSPKAIHQLSAAIERIFRFGSPSKVDGIDPDGIATVFPVVVTRDDIGATIGICGFLNLLFDQVLERRKLRVSVAPLLCLAAEDMERISAYLRDVELSAILEAHHRANRKRGKYLTHPFFTVENTVMEKLGVRRPPGLTKALDEFGEVATSHLGLRP